MKLRVFSAALVLLGLTGCSLRFGYTEVPAVLDYFSKQLSSAELQRLKEAAICFNEDGPRSAWYTTVLLDNKAVYHYQLVPADGKEQKNPAVTLAYSRTENQLAIDEKQDIWFYQGCLGPRRDVEVLIREGGRWFGEKTASAPDQVVVNNAFDDAAKARVQLTAKAVQSAIATAKNATPNESTWGVKP